ncbi:hypothetical protein [Limosilactobacillus balticus]|uniref:hypothetical protein n=1 Tax=Limosilactobacillus balticus TaxID=2759747 RepID=UPI001E421F3A|nr:hypothetical protein [Limosilactobacillus balticus]MCD7132619.1 hypothetical protein [Limosilactobacillus balticus]
MTITSDPMFGLVMQNKEICLELINRALLNIKAKQIIQLDTQKDISIVGAEFKAKVEQSLMSTI